VLVFFCQAEDGIRDFHVTGVQTCALPIFNYEDHHGETPLFFAVINKQKQTILHLLDNGANPQINDFQGNSLLHILAKTGQQDVTEKLIGLGLDVNALNKDGLPPLLIATRNKFLPIVKLLIQNGADVDFTDKMGNSALSIAVENNVIPMVNLLLDNGASVNLSNDSNESPLLIAVRLVNRIVAEKLIEQGEDIFAETREGISPVWYAVGANQKELVNVFLQKGLSADYARSVDAWDGKDGSYME